MGLDYNWFGGFNDLGGILGFGFSHGFVGVVGICSCVEDIWEWVLSLWVDKMVTEQHVLKTKSISIINYVILKWIVFLLFLKFYLSMRNC